MRINHKSSKLSTTFKKILEKEALGPDALKRLI